MDKMQARFRELFSYKDGLIVRRISACSRASKGAIVSYKEPNGYLRVRVDGKRYGVHQIVFSMHHGYIPNCIDHINGNKEDNRIENLREATVHQNGYNSKKPVTNTSGIKNVQFIGRLNKWQVRMKIKSVNKTFGYYDNQELAELVAIEARSKYHGAFANHGFKEQLA